MDWGTPARQRREVVLRSLARLELLQLLGRHPGSGRRLPAQAISDGPLHDQEQLNDQLQQTRLLVLLSARTLTS